MDGAPVEPADHGQRHFPPGLGQQGLTTLSMRPARFTGVDAGYLCHLEHGRRVPRIVVAEALISGLKLGPT